MLHKTSFMKRFHLLATDGEIGHVDDFLVDEDWNLRYLVVDTSNRLGGRWVSTPVQNLTVPPVENLTDRRGDEPQFVAAS